MARNWIQPGDVITIPAAGIVASGEVVIVGEMVGVAANSTSDAGQPLDLEVTGVWELPKVGANTFAIGAPVYWKADDKLVTSTAGGNTKIGYATQVAGNDAATVKVRLFG